MSKKKLIIADITSLKNGKQSFGHFFHVADMYSKLFEDKSEVIIAGGPIYKEKFKNLILLKYDIDLREFGCIFLKIRSKIKEFLNARYVLKNVSNSIIVFQDYSNLILFLSLYFFKSNNKIYLIQYKNEIAKGIKKIIFKKISRRISGIICSKKSVGEVYKIPYIVVPDYIYYNDNMYNSNNEECKYDYGVFGIIRRGKDVVGVAKRFINSNLKLIIAGSIQDEEIKRELESLTSQYDNIKVLDEYLPVEKYNKLISKTKCVILPYIDDYYNESSSGVVFDILFRGKPVITRRYEIFEFIETYKLGYLYDDLVNLDLNMIIEENNYIQYKKNIIHYLKLNSQSGKLLGNFLKL